MHFYDNSNLFPRNKKNKYKLSFFGHPTWLYEIPKA